MIAEKCFSLQLRLYKIFELVASLDSRIVEYLALLQILNISDVFGGLS